MTVAAVVKRNFVPVRSIEFPAVVATQTGGDAVLVHEVAGESGMGSVTFDAAVFFGDRRVLDGFVQTRLNFLVA